MEQNRFNRMKQFFLYGMIGFLLTMISCQQDDPLQTFQIKVKPVYPAGYEAKTGVAVKLENTSTHAIFKAPTDANGVATFDVTAGMYAISYTEIRTVDLKVFIFNGTNNNLIVSNQSPTDVDLPLLESVTNQLVIKELYCGGCQKDDGSGTFQRDPYVILYNNSSQPATFQSICLGIVNPYNSNGTNNDYKDGTTLFYQAEGWIPENPGIWTFQQSITLEPYQQIVIALNNAVDNTKTYKQSINFDNPAYYCAYDIAVYSNTTYYVPPAPSIPTSHYLKAYHFGAGNAWTMSVTSPAFYIFEPKGMTPQEWANSADNTNLYGTTLRRKVPVDWVIDAVEVFAYANAANHKRLTPAVDAGYVELFNQYGFTLYRNVDQEATEAIPENEGKLVYGYALGTKGITVGSQVINGTTDPSGIDAEASIKNGARIIYLDTNNSSNDFHQRSRASLRN